MSKILIAYYSRKGNNYVGGKIVDLSVGNTAVIAQKIQSVTGGDLFEIQTVKQYPDDYAETTDLSKIELKQNARPELSTLVTDMERYDTIYLGFPNWWGTMPMAVFTFLESYDFAGKTIIPFVTHEGSGFGKSESDLNRFCPDAVLLKGIAVRGSTVATADTTIRNWLNQHHLI